jgi:NAD(P)-dependent dehydrogenase (short-subunit alcohol dehydrogenase family)
MTESARDRFQRILDSDRDGRVDFTKVFSPIDFAGKSVLITGGASGIGAATARMFASHDAHVIIADRDAQAGEALASETKQHFVQVDVTSWASQVAMFAAALKALPSPEIDILVTSAGVGGSADWKVTPSSVDELLSEGHHLEPLTTECLDVGLIGCLNTIHLGSKYAMGLEKSDHGDKAVIMLGSLAGYTGFPDLMEYTTAKWAVRGAFRCMRASLLELGARTNLLAPTFVETPMTARMVGALRSRGVKIVEMDMVLKAMARMAADTNMSGKSHLLHLRIDQLTASVGRAVAVTGDGIIDLCDDAHGLDAGQVMYDTRKAGITGPLASASLKQP